MKREHLLTVEANGPCEWTIFQGKYSELALPIEISACMGLTYTYYWSRKNPPATPNSWEFEMWVKWLKTKKKNYCYLIWMSFNLHVPPGEVWRVYSHKRTWCNLCRFCARCLSLCDVIGASIMWTLRALFSWCLPSTLTIILFLLSSSTGFPEPWRERFDRDIP